MQTLCYENQRVLVLAPHADDETLGCAGVIQKYVGAGSVVRVVIASFVKGTYRRFQKHQEVYTSYSGDERYQELAGAMSLLGVTDYTILYEDNDVDIQYHSLLDTRPRAELTAAIENQMQNFQPTVLFIPTRTKHQDHIAVHDACITAARPYFWQGSVIAYETDGETEFAPNLYVALTDKLMQTKLDAIRCYKTQLSAHPHPVSERTLCAKAQFRGQYIYASYAEAFQILRLYG